MSPSCWTPPGQTINIAGYDISAGLVYHGRHLRTADGAPEPALIDPHLPVHDAALDGAALDGAALDGAALSYGHRPSYHLLSPTARAGYLRWLAGGRRDTNAPIGFPLLFLFGLERRVLVDADHDRGVRAELPAIAAELRRLRSGYAGDAAFATVAGSLLDVIELVGAARPRPGGAVAFAQPPAPPPPGTDHPQAPMTLRIALARCAATGTPVPAEWARSWLGYHPRLPERAPQRRCPREFDRLFALRYTRRYGPGLVPAGTDVPIRISYQPASPGMAATVIQRPDLPDVLTSTRSTAAIGALLREVTGALTPYSRWLAKHPDGQGSLAATAWLPDDLVDPASGPLSHLLGWATAHLDGRPSAVFDATELGVFWSCADPARMTREESEGLSVVLAKIGLGVEPDVRFAGPGIVAGPAVLFRLDGTAGTALPDRLDGTAGTALPDRAMLTAAAAVDLAATLVCAREHDGAGVGDNDGDDVIQKMIDEIIAEVGTVTGAPVAVPELMSESWLTRLSARLRWRATNTSNATVPLSAMAPSERVAAGRFLVTVAAHITGVTPAVVTALIEAYRLLGLDPDLVSSRLIRAMDGQGPGHRIARGPVVVRQASDAEPGYALPWAAGAKAEAEAPAERPSSKTIHLDQAILARRRSETDDVSALLSTIFTTTEDEGGTTDGAEAAQPPSAAATPAPGAPLVTGLDQQHSCLLHELAARHSLGREEFEALAARHGVLPDGAIDLLNEVAFQAAGEPVVEGDDDLSINDYAVQELLR